MILSSIKPLRYKRLIKCILKYKVFCKAKLYDRRQAYILQLNYEYLNKYEYKYYDLIIKKIYFLLPDKNFKFNIKKFNINKFENIIKI
jgi:hypothetical protein